MSYSIIDRAVFGPRHAKPRRGLKTAAKGSAIAALLAATGFAGAGLAAMTPAPSPAAFAGESATAVLNVNLTSYHAVNWEQRTCSAFTAYQAHPTRRGMQAVVIDSTYLGQSYLKADVGQWEADASSPSAKAAKYAAKDPGYVGQDCGQ